MASCINSSRGSSSGQQLDQRRRLIKFEPIHRSCAVISFIVMISCTIWPGAVTSQPAAPTTNPVDLRVVHEIMSAMYYEYDWATNVPDPCVSSPQGIVCEADATTGVLYVTQLQFGFISPIANIIPCSANASIPASITNLTRLNSLAFHNCFTNQTTTLPTSFPPSLHFLSITRNPALTGPLPTTLTSLQRLVLCQNSLQGTIPETLTSLPTLTQLDLSHNQLSGSIPLNFSPSLINLDLRFNALTGTFPIPLSQGAHNLQRLALSHNKLSGALPDTFTGLDSLTFLDLSSNNLTGPLPPSLTTLLRLEDLFLNANRFNDTIPEGLSKLTKLVRLDLSSCALTGAIPVTFQRMESLRFFSVSRNRLSGSIPVSLSSLPVIFTLNLDRNQLSGPVPFPASFVQKMGRNLQLKENAGLCYNPQLVILKLLLPGLKQCPETANLRPVSSPANSIIPNGANPSHCVDIARILLTTFVAAASWTLVNSLSSI